MKKWKKANVSSCVGAALAVSVLGGTASIACTSEGDSSTARVVTQNQSQLGSFEVLDATSEQGVALWATEWAEIGDRVEVYEGAAPGGISNSGTGILRVGSDASVGSIWAEGSVDLRDRATVNGAVFVNTAALLSQGNQVTITSGVTTGDLGATTDIFDDPPEFEVQGGDVQVEPGEYRAVVPGHYGELTVKANSGVRFLAGDYSFSRLNVETNGKVLLPRQCALSRVRVREALFFRGKIVQTGADDALRLAIAYDGTQTAHIEASFSGAIMASNAELVLSSHRHEGRFFAKKLRVQSDAEIVGAGMLQCGQVAGDDEDAAGSGPVVPADLGPAPVLAGADDLDDFLEWFYRIRKSEIQEARDAIVPVTNDADVVAAAVARFQDARSNRSLGKALMLLTFIGALNADEAVTALIDLLEQPITVSAQPGEEGTLYHDELAYRRQAINHLNDRQTPTALAAVENAAFNHTDRNVRGAGIRALSWEASDSQRAALKSQIQPGDEFYVDRPNRTDPDFVARYSQMQQSYTN